ncbi:MAG: tetratricopeptide repeat protein [Deltaproteobacteria bacterium]|nr:tetratricopeptide repeat protein [Deltaproteobacteria bacterium]
MKDRAKDFFSRNLEGKSFRSGEMKDRFSVTGSLSSIRRRSKGIPPWSKGDRIKGRFEVHQVLGGPGKSGMGVVYIVIDLESGNPFAVKTLQDWCFRDARATARFEREAKLWTDLEKHPNIVRAFFIERISSRPYIFLEYISGADLSRWIKQGPLEVQRALRYAVQVARAMIHARTKIPGFIHRDIKPANCLLTSDDTLKLTDFGLSKAVAHLRESYDPVGGRPPDTTVTTYVSQAGRRAGTLPYMAPEAFTSKAEVDIQADIYSLGVTLYRMLASRLPFEARNVRDWMFHHLFTRPRDLCDLNPKVPRDLRAVVMKCMAKKPEDRYLSFEEIESIFSEMLWVMFGTKMPPIPKGGMEVWELCNKGLSYERLGRSAEALEFFDRALEINPDDAETLCNKGVALDSQERGGEALECYKKALEINPHLTEAWTNRGILMDRMERFDDALRCYERAVHENPRYIDAWMNKGATLGSLSRTEDALECFEEALRISSEYAEGWLMKGAALLELGRNAEALTCFERSLTINPDMPESWNGKGTSLAGLGRLDKALRSFERALELSAGNIESLRGKGMVLVDLDRPGEALVCFDEILAQGHTDLDALGSRGAALAALGRASEALDCFDQVLDACPIDAAMLKVKSATLFETDRLSEALDAVERALDLVPTDEDAWRRKAVILVGMDRHSEALDACDEALRYSPDDPEAWMIRGNAASGLALYEDALHCYDRALELSPREARFWLNRGMTLYMMQRDAEARDCFRIALELDPRLGDHVARLDIDLSEVSE